MTILLKKILAPYCYTILLALTKLIKELLELFHIRKISLFFDLSFARFAHKSSSDSITNIHSVVSLTFLNKNTSSDQSSL